MKRQIAAVCGTIVFVFGIPHAHATPVERDAVISDQLKGKTELFDEMAKLVRAFGYKCDSISAARQMVFSRGFMLSCNTFAYEYEIEDKGGNWRVTVK